MAATRTPHTLRSDLCDAVPGTYSIKDGAVGTAHLICPLPAEVHDDHPGQGNAQGNLNTLFLTYLDESGHDDLGGVSAALRFIRRSDGPVETVPNGSVGSNDPSAPIRGATGFAPHTFGSVAHGTTIGFKHKVNFDANYYYVQITLKRRKPAISVAAIGVYLT
jgi:hypothetical protein